MIRHTKITPISPSMKTRKNLFTTMQFFTPDTDIIYIELNQI